MNWMFWRKDVPFDFTVETTDVPTSTLYRWALYDLGITTPNAFAEAAGFIPISDEGEEMEKRDSVSRLRAVEPYVGFIDTMATINGEILAETLSSVLKKYNLVNDDLSIEDEKDIMAELYTSISISALVPALSAALKLGILVNPGMFITEGSYDYK
jgi:hypothetical protein